MFPLAPLSMLLKSMTESTITLTNIIVQFPIAVAYQAGLRRR